MWEKVARKLEPLRDLTVMEDLQGIISSNDFYTTPYFSIIKRYSERSGTIGGILKCLEECQNLF